MELSSRDCCLTITPVIYCRSGDTIARGLALTPHAKAYLAENKARGTVMARLMLQRRVLVAAWATRRKRRREGGLEDAPHKSWQCAALECLPRVALAELMEQLCVTAEVEAAATAARGGAVPRRGVAASL